MLFLYYLTSLLLTIKFVLCETNIAENMWHNFQQHNKNSNNGRHLGNKQQNSNSSKSFNVNDFEISSSIWGLDFPHLDEKVFDEKSIPPNSKMLELLGLENYDTDYMRIFRPGEAARYPNGRIEVGKSTFRFKGIRDIFKRYMGLPYNSWHEQRRVSRKMRRQIRRFLGQYTACPVLARWVDRGPKFWPRWNREGRCVDMGGASCSVPAGMWCRPAEHRNVRVFRHICLKEWMNNQCRWYRISVPIITKCQCQCS